MADVDSFGRGNPLAMTRKLVDEETYVLTNAGAPTNGTSGTFAGFAGIGSILLDSTNGKFYLNVNTKASPTWSLELDSVADGNPVKINSRSYTQTSGSSIGFQTKPNQTVTTTGDVIGAEFSPRANDAGAGAVIAIKADPVIKTATAIRTVSAVRGIEINIDLPLGGSAYTFTNAVCGIRMFPNFGSGHTFSANRPAILLATPNTTDWTHLLEVETASVMAVVAAGTFTTADGHLVIDVAGTDYQIPFYIGAD